VGKSSSNRSAEQMKTNGYKILIGKTQGMLEKSVVMVWTGLNWLSIWSIGVLL
jgi:hypothetical protein